MTTHAANFWYSVLQYIDSGMYTSGARADSSMRLYSKCLLLHVNALHEMLTPL